MIRILLIVFLFLSSSCKKEECPDGKNGIIKDYTGLDGCGFIIELNNGNKIEPVNWDEVEIELEDDKKVRVSYTVKENYASICMVGDIVEITCIEAR